MDISVKVVPKSSKTAMAGRMADGAWKIKVAAAPEKGKANRALCEYLARHFHVPLSRVRILSGQTAPIKRIRIEGIP